MPGADDLGETAFDVRQLDRVSDGVAVREVGARERLVDHRDVGAVLVLRFAP
jgi:hypothetical protein